MNTLRVENSYFSMTLPRTITTIGRNVARCLDSVSSEKNIKRRSTKKWPGLFSVNAFVKVFRLRIIKMGKMPQ